MKMKKLHLLSFVGLFSAVLAGGVHAAAEGWFDDALKVRKAITVTPGAGGAGLDQATATFPFALRLSAQTIAFDDLAEDGSDLRVVGPDGQRVAHYVESLDREGAIGVVWVAGKNLDPRSPQTYQVYYGGDVDSVANASAVFDASELMALDFSGESPGADRTRNANDAAGSVPTSAGFAGLSATFRGNDVIQVAPSTSLSTAAGSAFTAMAWVKTAQPQTGALIQRAGFTLGLANGQPVAQVGGVQIAGGAISPNAWTHLALVGGADGRIELYVNGKSAAVGQAAIPAMTDGVAIGQGIVGQIDNVRYAAAVRSPGYIAAVAASDAGRGLVAFGTEETHSAGFEIGYFITVIENVTIEGWVVIGLCAILLAIAIWVMITKSAQVGLIERENAAFQQAYKGQARLDDSDLRLNAERNGASTLSELYQTGMLEVSHRETGGRSTFTPAAIESLKARIDAALTDQAYRLSDRLVMLTLAISGGPFLGLLGTVIGVMITFAAIAAEGNVNVNAIAPGVAAALLATAAGLLVAIPALFGYNMILTRIKRINATSRSFGDALVARIAENYSA